MTRGWRAQSNLAPTRATFAPTIGRAAHFCAGYKDCTRVSVYQHRIRREGRGRERGLLEQGLLRPRTRRELGASPEIVGVLDDEIVAGRWRAELEADDVLYRAVEPALIFVREQQTCMRSLLGCTRLLAFWSTCSMRAKALIVAHADRAACRARPMKPKSLSAHGCRIIQR